MSSIYKVMCGCECFISAKNIHSSLLLWSDRYFKNSNIKQKFSKQKLWGKIKLAYMKHIKIQSCRMGVIFTPKHMTQKSQQCVHTNSQIIRYHTGNVYYNGVPNVQALIFLTRKQMISILTPDLQFVLTFII